MHIDEKVDAMLGLAYGVKYGALAREIIIATLARELLEYLVAQEELLKRFDAVEKELRVSHQSRGTLIKELKKLLEEEKE